MFRTVLIDPPWPERGAGRITRGAQKHYRLLPVDEMESTVRACEHWDSVAYEAHCYLWTTSNYLPDALQLMSDLGFEYKTNVVWVKTRQLEPLRGVLEAFSFELNRFRESPQAMLSDLGRVLTAGLGQYFRGQHELLLFGVRGRGFANKTERRDLRSVILAPRGEHSEKPEASYELVEQRSLGPYLELFSRRKRQGWTVWGEEVHAGVGDAR